MTASLIERLVSVETEEIPDRDRLALDIYAVLIQHGIRCDVPDVTFLRRSDGTVRGVTVHAYDRPVEPPAPSAFTEYHDRVNESGRSVLARLTQTLEV